MAALSDPVSTIDHMRGREDAPVMIVEYGDYECVASGYAHFVIQQLMNDFGENLAFVFRSFPMTQIRPNALPAALAAEAAGAQERYWEMHDMLFEYQDALAPEQLLVYAQVLGLDIERFIIDMTSDKMAAHIRHDFVSGVRSGVDITPVIFINGQRQEGPYDYKNLQAAVNKALKATRKRRSRKPSRRTTASAPRRR